MTLVFGVKVEYSLCCVENMLQLLGKVVVESLGVCIARREETRGWVLSGIDARGINRVDEFVWEAGV